MTYNSLTWHVNFFISEHLLCKTHCNYLSFTFRRSFNYVEHHPLTNRFIVASFTCKTLASSLPIMSVEVTREHSWDI